MRTTVGEGALAGRVDINFHRLTYPEHKRAGILKPPLHVGNSEMSIGDPVVLKDLHPDRHGEFMVSTMEGEDAVHLHG